MPGGTVAPVTDSHLADLFPARVTYPVGSHPGFRDKVRVILFAERALIFAEGKNRVVELVHDLELTRFDRPIAARNAFDLYLTNGEMWQIGRGTGCGCGSPLKRMQTRDLLALAAVSA